MTREGDGGEDRQPDLKESDQVVMDNDKIRRHGL